jgi:hypothetical protein
MLRVLSLGAGVQSTTLALMAAHGEIEAPDCAIFADTGDEPAAVYAHLAWLTPLLPFPVHHVSRGDLREDCLRNVRGELAGRKRTTIPAFTYGKDGRGSPLNRQCTLDYKIVPIIEKVRELAGIKSRSPGPKHIVVEQMIGISTDEASRMKPSRKRWIKHIWPLIEVGRSRNGCLEWLDKRGYPRAPKSACVMCPWHSNAMWRDMKDNDLPSWDRAVDFDRAIRPGFMGSRTEAFLHRDLIPLDHVDLSNWAERGQADLFNNECEGMCGV